MCGQKERKTFLVWSCGLACMETRKILKVVKRWDRKTMKICNVWGEANNNNLNFEFVKIQKELFLKKCGPLSKLFCPYY